MANRFLRLTETTDPKIDFLKVIGVNKYSTLSIFEGSVQRVQTRVHLKVAWLIGKSSTSGAGTASWNPSSDFLKLS